MPIQAQSFDGVVHEFPDGTPDNVVDSAIKNYTQEQMQVDPTTGMTFGGLKHAAVIPTEAAKGIPVLGAAVPDTEDTKQLEKDMPVVAAGAKGVGAALATAPFMAMAPEVFGMKAGAPLLQNVLAGATSGGALSAADATARGEDIGPQAVTGAITGGAVPVVGKAIGAIVKYLAPDIASSLKGFDPKALDWASQAAKADGLTDAQVAAKMTALGPQGFLAEYSPRLKGAAAAVASQPGSGAGKQALMQGFESRVEGQPDRITSGLDKLLGKSKNLVQEGIQNATDRENMAGPLFDQFRKSKVPPTPEVKQLVQELDDHGLLKEAQDKAALQSLASGKPVSPTTSFFTTGPQKDWPTAESWSYVKRAIDDRIDRSYDANGHATQNTRLWRDVKNRIDQTILGANKPAANTYQQARNIWESSKAIDNARIEGQKVWSNTYNKDQLLQDLTSMSQTERDAFKEGARASLRDRLEASVNGDNNVRNLLRSDSAKAKMHMLAENKKISGNDVDTFLNQMEQEAGYGKAVRELGTNTQREATKEMQGKLAPNPQDTLVARARERFHYSPHVTPIKLIPGLSALQKAAERRQASSYEAARDSLGKLLSNKGSAAADMARALLNYNPNRGSQGAMNAVGIARQLAQPSLPGTPLPIPGFRGQ